MLQPVVRRTWAPKGCTPIQYSWDRHDRISAISAITVSPRQHRLGLYFALHEHNIRASDVEAFVAELLEHCRRGLILVLDRSGPHRSAARRLEKRFGRRVQIEWLPAYAPDLNPDEQVWNQAKYADLANFIPDDVTELREAVEESLERTGTQQSLLRSYFKHAQLRL
jgi:transposase